MATKIRYGSIARAQLLASSARTSQRIAPGPHRTPPRPRPRTPEEDSAVATFAETPCHAKSRTPGRAHLIPATSTICIRCGTDAITRQETP